MFENGLQKGIKNNQREIVLNMIENNFSIDDIIKCTKLSKEEIDMIIKKSDKVR